jgi:hypothetical protein
MTIIGWHNITGTDGRQDERRQGSRCMAGVTGMPITSSAGPDLADPSGFKSP